jgi:ribonuclease HI
MADANARLERLHRRNTILTSPSGDKLFYAVQLCFKPEHKVSNNIAEYEGLLAGLRAVNALGIKCLVVKGDSQLVVNF